jgi:hypothetical protein
MTAIRPISDLQYGVANTEPRGVPRVNDRRVLNGIFWILRSGAPWRDLPESFGPYTNLLQPVRSLTEVWHLGPDHGGLAETHDGVTLVALARYYRSQPEIGCPIGCF